MASVDPMTGLSYDDERAVASALGRNWWALLVLLLCAAAVYGIVSLGDGAIPASSFD